LVLFKQITNPKQTLNTTWSYLSRGSHCTADAFPILSLEVVTVSAEPPFLAALPPIRLHERLNAFRSWNPAMKTARGRSPLSALLSIALGLWWPRGLSKFTIPHFLFSFIPVSFICRCIFFLLWCFVHSYCLFIFLLYVYAYFCI